MPHLWVDDSRSLYASPEGWSINPAPGWTVAEGADDSHGERQAYVDLVSPWGDATVRFATYDPARCSAEVWINAGEQMDRAKGRTVTAARCGLFTGYETCFGAGEVWLRCWALRLGTFPLGAVYRCPMSLQGRDDAALEWMLASLYFRRVPT